jgi:hypothetical protein
MKLEFSLTVKAVPTASINISIDCNADELSIMLSDPVYQELGAKLINEVSFAPKQEKSQNNQHRIHELQQKHADNLHRQVEVMQHAMSVLERRMDAFRKSHPDFS